MIPTYNQVGYVESAIASALSQDYDNLEVILADDCSTDDTPRIAARYQSDKRFRYMRNTRNLGRVANYRQTLYQHATGDWVLNLDGDDFLLVRDYVSDVMAHVGACSQTVLAFGGCRLLSASGLCRTFLPTRQPWECMNGFDYFLRWGVDLGVPHASALYARRWALDLDFYRFDIISSDWESLRRLVLQGKVLLCGREVCAWRIHERGASHDMSVQQRLDDLSNVTKPYAYALSLGLPPLPLAQWQRRTLDAYVANFLRLCAEEGELSSAWEFMARLRDCDRSVFRSSLLRMPTNIPLLGLIAIRALGGKALTQRLLYLWHRLIWH